MKSPPTVLSFHAVLVLLPPQHHCSSLPVSLMQSGLERGYLADPFLTFKMRYGKAITTCQSSIRAPNRTQWDDTTVQGLIWCWTDGERKKEGQQDQVTDHIPKKWWNVPHRNSRKVWQRTTDRMEGVWTSGMCSVCLCRWPRASFDEDRGDTCVMPATLLGYASVK